VARRPLESAHASTLATVAVSSRGDPQQVTALLVAWSDGDRDALDRLLPLVEDELKLLAHRYLRRENPGHTLQTTALVNEAYLRLVDQKRTQWRSRAHFFGIAARLMRRILIDHARGVTAAKRGGRAPHVALDEVCVVDDGRAAELVALDDALGALAQVDERKSRVVELRYFGGLTADEIGEVLGLHPDTVGREWQRAKVFLRRQLEAGR
jgi:RNA polymerase sigma factor (TIGR02999 family)